ncbi:cytochrome d ubiquinol oxidase subunit 1 [Asticcacaulis biprosthecium C19]|uniref:Cytochrome d ubiquinol oxidase subunit 1 n=1 Tax=Asticcacaulis biprosthecium C19 TaxID=715226 RepID=F4QTC6_9CAUL|nr:cytochrome ubiquinol oxidase subunit I [Asticcacaulis biprosthecium]EGF89996.1 cytochrome d ubiquinol oxidase subunit 1 [Asticcacaulis biprosthecium C19]
MDLSTVDLSRLQFALTAMYHFLFVPLTLGLSFMLVIMESVYVLTRKEIWRTITRFWGTLFAINFVLGVATGLTMEFQFGTNWSYYSHYVGDIFGAPLAIEGLMAFFLEATFVGLMFFGWDRLSKPAHLMVTFLVALGTNLSALWILIANGWMQNPVGAEFNPQTMRMEVSDFMAVLFNPVAQAKFVHTVSAGYVLAAVFVLAVSAIYLIRGKWVSVAKRSMAVAAAFGLASSLSVVVLGDESGYALTDNQRMKLAALESMWHTEDAPAGISLFGIPNVAEQRTDYDVKVPYVLGLIATRSLDKPVIGILDLVEKAEGRIRSGIIAYDAVETLKLNPDDFDARGRFEVHKADLGYGYLLKKYVADPRTADEATIARAAMDTVPNVPLMFWAFRLMAGLGFAFIALFALAFFMVTYDKVRQKWFLVLCIAALPFPWIAIEGGWLLAEIGRQPWAVEGVLPTFMGASSLTKTQIWITIVGFTLLYGGLAFIEIKLMIRAIRKGPYHSVFGRLNDEPVDVPTAAPAE